MKKLNNTKNDLVVDIKNKLLELMKTEGADWTKSWIGSGLHRNAFTKKPYRGANLFWLPLTAHSNEWKCNQWATFKQWSDNGYKIKKGSTHTKVYFWEVKEKKEEWLSDLEKQRYAQTKKLPTYLLLKVHQVFNGDQVEDFEYEQYAQHKTELSADDTAFINFFVQNTEAEIVHNGAFARYYPFQDKINMPNIKSFHSDVDYYSTLMHELTHWTKIEERTNRDAKELSYAEEELVAEIGSAFLCAWLGIEKTPRADHAQYLNAWIKQIGEMPEREVLKYFTLAQKALDFFMDLHESKVKEVA